MIEHIRESGYKDPVVAIEQDEVLRSMNHTIGYRVFLGWAITQGVAGSVLVLFFSDLFLVGTVLFGFSLLSLATWQMWITGLGLIRAAKEQTLSKPAARRIAKKIAIVQGVFFALLMGTGRAFLLEPDDSYISAVVFGALCGVFFGFSMWFLNGRLSRKNHEA
ncbi:MAG: hypothetical protein EHM43_04760 [Ignavibacteriae bacterium]|nr:MAG: hypothetical protein EHM43_04760 [Ignavibacteriota bacterium]